MRVHEGLADAPAHRLESEHQKDHEVLVPDGVATDSLDPGFEELLLLAWVLHLVDPMPLLHQLAHLLAVR